ncbi:MAG: hypothetical protein ACI8QZ_001767 [Chlamydiales bacterium]|jgi:hypothetical protein
MTPHTSFSFGRIWRLTGAQWALLAGFPERAFDLLRDPLLADSMLAGSLREKAMDRLCACAALRAGEGREGSVLRLLSLVEVESADRARDWRARLVREPRRPKTDGGVLSALLADMRSSDAGDQDRSAAESSGSGESAGAPPFILPGSRPVSVPSGSGGPGASLRFQMAVDDGGEFLVVAGARITLGHSSSGVADIPLLADIESIHAHFIWAESFHAGPGWKIEPSAKARVSIGGVPVVEARSLRDGDLVELAPQLSFRFRLPEAASASALLEFQGGAEAEGAARVVLLAGGVAGRIRIGALRARHVPVGGLEFDVSLTLGGRWPGQDGDQVPEDGAAAHLEVECEGGVRLASVPAEEGAGVACSIPLPLAGRLEVIANARPSRRLPFGIALQPLERLYP